MLTILTIILFFAGIFAGVTTLMLLGTLAFSWLMQPLIDGFYYDKKYPLALGLKVIVYALIAVAFVITFLEISNTLISLLKGQSWDSVVRPEGFII